MCDRLTDLSLSSVIVGRTCAFGIRLGATITVDEWEGEAPDSATTNGKRGQLDRRSEQPS